MKLEKQVISLELAKKLKKLGFKQESLFWWFEYKDKQGNIYNISDRHKSLERPKGAILTDDNKIVCSAFTVAELGELLPNNFTHRIHKWKNKGFSFYIDDKIIETETEADIRAKMLIYLIENKLLSK